MMKEIFALSFGFAVLIAAAGIAEAQANCAPRDVVAQRLAAGYGETRQSIGLAADNSVLEVYASLETGTWTITVTAPGGPTCMVASGYAFEAMAEEPPASGKRA